MTTPEIIQNLRGAMNMAEFAKKVGCSRQYISMCESGKRIPPMETLREWATIMGKDLLISVT